MSKAALENAITLIIAKPATTPEGRKVAQLVLARLWAAVNAMEAQS